MLTKSTNLSPRASKESFVTVRLETEDTSENPSRSTQEISSIPFKPRNAKHKVKSLIKNIFESFGTDPSFNKDENSTAQHQLSAELGNFQLQMIALGGSVGSGLFIGSGDALWKGGPGSLVICFPLIGTMIWSMCQAAAEMAVILPVVGSFSYYASTFIDESWGFAMGLNYAMQWLILLPLELVAASMTFKFWESSFNIPEPALITIFFFMIICINLMSVKVYGWFEVGFSMCKVIAVVAFIILGITFCAKPGIISQNYWVEPGSFSHGYRGVLSSILTAAFSFAGTELTALAASETVDVRKQIPKATKQIFWRILCIYMACLTLIGFLVPFNDPALMGNSSAKANGSPFVIAIRNGGIRGFPSVMNVIILISILSVGNSAIYASSRTLVFLARSGLVPKGKYLNLEYIDRKGRPIVATLFTLAFGALAYISCFSPEGAQTMFKWLLALSGLSSVFTWGTMCLCHIVFRAALKAQKRSLDELPTKALFGIGGSYYGFIINVLILIIQFYVAINPVEGQMGVASFFKAYLAVPFVLFCFSGDKILVRLKRGNWGFNKRFETIDLDTGRRETDREALILSVIEEEKLNRQKTWYRRWYRLWC